MTTALVVVATAVVAGIVAVEALAGARSRLVAVGRLRSRSGSGSGAGSGAGSPVAAVPSAVDRWVAEMALPWQPVAAWRAWLGAVAGAAAGGWALGGPVLAAVAGGAAVAAPGIARRVTGDRRLAALDGAVPAALEAVARGLRSGASLLQAIDAAAAAAPGLLAADLRRVADRARLGADLPAALDAWSTHRPRPGVRLAAAALALAAETGGASARSVDGVAATLRERRALDREVAALSAQARLSALVIGVAPLVFAGFAAATDPRTAAFLFRSPLGLACLTAGVALDGAGAWWMHRLTRERP